MTEKTENVAGYYQLSTGADPYDIHGTINPGGLSLTESDLPFVNYLPTVACTFAILMGILVLIGWSLDIPAFKSFAPGFTTMKPLAAVSFIAGGIALYVLTRPKSIKGGRILRSVAYILACAVSFLSFLVLCEYIFSWDTGLDQIMFRDEVATEEIRWPGRMAFTTALNFFLIGPALVLINVETKRGFRPSQWIGVFVAVVSLFALSGYVIGMQTTYQAPFSTALPINAAIAFLIFSLGFLFSHGNRGLPAVVLKNSLGGTLMRRLLPVALILPFLFRWVRMKGEQSGFSENDFGIALFATANIFILTFLIWRSALSLDRTDSQRERAELTVVKSAKDLENIKYALDESSIVAITDQTGKINFVNDKFCEISGYSREELLGQDHRIINSGYHSKEFIRKIWITIASGKVWHGEIKNRAKNGSFYWVDTTIVPFLNDKGKPYQYVAIRNDITQRKLSEEKTSQLAAIVESSEDSIISTTLDGVITSWNKGAERMYGYSAEEMIGQTKAVLFPPADVRQLKSELAAAILGKQIEHTETERIKKDGTQITVFVTTSPIRDSDEEIVGVSFIARDITARKKAEKDLQESKAQLETIVENLDEGVVVSDLHGTLMHFNRAALDMHGFASLEECHLHLNQFTEIFELREIDGSLLPVEEWPLARVLNGEKLRDKEIKIRKIATGKERIFNYGGTLVHDAHGSPLLAVVTIGDITERKRSEEALKNNEHRFRTLIEHGSDSIALIDQNNKILYLSPSVKTVEGYEPEELLGRSGVEHTHPDDLPLVKNAVEELLKNPGRPISRIWRRKHKDGHWMWLEGISTNLLNDPVVGAIVTNYRDITKRKEAEEELRESEERYRLLFENNPYPMWVYDLETLSFLAVNEAATHYYGYSEKEFLSMTIKDIRPPEDIPALLENVSRSLNKIDSADTWKHRKKDGTVIDVEVTSHELLFDGRRSRLVLANDVTVRRQAENAIRQLNETLEQRVVERTEELAAANKELEAFSYSVSHDLRAPLRAIDGFSLALLEDYASNLDAEGQGYLTRVRLGSQRMAQLIDDLLKLSRITRTEFVREAVDLSKVATEISDRLRESQPERDVKLIIQPGVTAYGDERLLRVALENLLGNAWKFTSKRDDAEISFGQDGNVYFVRDNGAGFDMAYADKLFGAFQRLHSTADFEGTGIGLATVQRVIRRHGGNIYAESKVGEGTAFYFTLTGQEARRGK